MRTTARRWLTLPLLVGFALVAMGQDSCSTDTGDDNESSRPAKEKQDGLSREEIEESITPEMVVDVMGENAVRKTCRTVSQLGYDTGLSFFKVGFQGRGGITSKEAFDEILSRC